MMRKATPAGFLWRALPTKQDLRIATRLRNRAFKRVLKDLPDGTHVKLDAPYGSFTLENNPAIPAVFLTGGIGITPVRSMVLQATHTTSPRRIVVFYSNRGPEDAAFLDDLRQAATQSANFTFVPTMTKMEHARKPWTGETGYVTKAMLERYLDDLTGPIYYISGPATLVSAMRKLLNDTGVDDDNIRTEEFTGYSTSAPSSPPPAHSCRLVAGRRL